MKALDLVEKMEFHEYFNKSRYNMPAVELWVYVKDMEKFLEVCYGPEEWQGNYGKLREYQYRKNELLKRSKAKRPHFDMLINHTNIDIYPKENIVVSSNVGLHYICQHIFDFLPYEEKEGFYPSIPQWDFVVGNLIIDWGKEKGKTYEIKASYILNGFMLTRQQIDKVGDSLSDWVRYMKEREAKGLSGSYRHIE